MNVANTKSISHYAWFDTTAEDERSTSTTAEELDDEENGNTTTSTSDAYSAANSNSTEGNQAPLADVASSLSETIKKKTKPPEHESELLTLIGGGKKEKKQNETESELWNLIGKDREKEQKHPSSSSIQLGHPGNTNATPVRRSRGRENPRRSLSYSPTRRQPVRRTRKEPKPKPQEEHKLSAVASSSSRNYQYESELWELLLIDTASKENNNVAKKEKPSSSSESESKTKTKTTTIAASIPPVPVARGQVNRGGTRRRASTLSPNRRNINMTFPLLGYTGQKPSSRMQTDLLSATSHHNKRGYRRSTTKQHDHLGRASAHVRTTPAATRTTVFSMEMLADTIHTTARSAETSAAASATATTDESLRLRRTSVDSSSTGIDHLPPHAPNDDDEDDKDDTGNSGDGTTNSSHRNDDSNSGGGKQTTSVQQGRSRYQEDARSTSRRYRSSWSHSPQPHNRSSYRRHKGCNVDNPIRRQESKHTDTTATAPRRRRRQSSDGPRQRGLSPKTQAASVSPSRRRRSSSRSHSRQSGNKMSGRYNRHRRRRSISHDPYNTADTMIITTMTTMKNPELQRGRQPRTAAANQRPRSIGPDQGNTSDTPSSGGGAHDPIVQIKALFDLEGKQYVSSAEIQYVLSRLLKTDALDYDTIRRLVQEVQCDIDPDQYLQDLVSKTTTKPNFNEFVQATIVKQQQQDRAERIRQEDEEIQRQHFQRAKEELEQKAHRAREILATRKEAKQHQRKQIQQQQLQ